MSANTNWAPFANRGVCFESAEMLYYAAQKEEVRPKLKKGLWAKVLQWILEIMSNRIDTMDNQQRVWWDEQPKLSINDPFYLG